MHHRHAQAVSKHSVTYTRRPAQAASTATLAAQLHFKSVLANSSVLAAVAIPNLQLRI